jgi:DNA repair exonuclease SbcCD ATPase subunit
VLRRLEIRNFQSLERVDIPLGLFTVITGPTSAGKSAVIRAVRLLARNARGTDYITWGASSCSVAAGDGRMVARITRSRARGRDAYHLAHLVPTPVSGGHGWTAAKYTKLNGQVPPQVTEALALGDLNFAGQFDMPYLLDVAGTGLARELGELTNVSMVLAAASEANRRRKQFERDLKAAVERRDALMEQAQAFAGLPGRRKAAAAAEEELGRLLEASASLERLRALTARLRAAETAAAEAAAEAARRAPPSIADLEDLARRAVLLEALLRRLREAEDAALELAVVARAEQDGVGAAHAALHDALKALGECPTCGSIIS